MKTHDLTSILSQKKLNKVIFLQILICIAFIAISLFLIFVSSDSYSVEDKYIILSPPIENDQNIEKPDSKNTNIKISSPSIEKDQNIEKPDSKDTDIKPDYKTDNDSIFELPMDREEINTLLIQMLDDWNELAFQTDDELLRHVCYFYKYYAIKNFAASNTTIKRAQKYLPYILKLVKSYKLPEEIAFAMPFVESSFKTNIRSYKGAVGMFQFMKPTARQYGLKVNKRIDERKNYKKSAHAFTRYLIAGRNLFASTVLSIGSYHHGIGGMSSVLMTSKKRTFSNIFKNKKLGKYSKEYIPQCLAAALIFRILKNHNLKFIPKQSIECSVIKKIKYVNKLKKSYPQLIKLNPDLYGVKKTYSYVCTNGYLLLRNINSKRGLSCM